MRTLVLCGTPHKNGNTAFLLKEWQKRVPGEYRMVWTYDSEISPCDDCGVCQKDTKCIKHDDMDELYRYWQTCDTVIVASPVYFSQLTGPLLCVASRFQAIWNGCYHKNKEKEPSKKGFAFLTGGGSAGKCRDALSGARAILSVLNAPLLGSVVACHTDVVPAWQDKDAMLALEACALRAKTV